MATQFIANSRIFNNCTRHIDIWWYMFVRDLVDKKIITIDRVPTSYVACLKIAISQWLIATEICVQDFALADIGDWVPIKDVKEKIISSRFVYQIKTRASGSVEAFCRWTPRGYEEEPEIHFDPEAVFAGTPQLWALRLIIVHALGRKFKTHHLDFKRAFSHAPIDKTIHVSMPKGYHC